MEKTVRGEGLWNSIKKACLGNGRIKRFGLTLEDDKGYQLSVMTYGATILEYVTPDKEDQFTNIILGFDRFEDYVGNSPNMGLVLGR